MRRPISSATSICSRTPNQHMASPARAVAAPVSRSLFSLGARLVAASGKRIHAGVARDRLVEEMIAVAKLIRWQRGQTITS
jgi:hypothetical protein